jgi:heme exporter protein C
MSAEATRLPGLAPQTYTPEKAKYSPGRTRLLYGLSGTTLLLVILGVILALAYAGQDVEQGDVQRIFYTHISSFFGAFIAFCVTVVGGIQYLRTRNVKWDTLALAGVEVGLMLAFVNLATGAIWARPIWNTWWTWDPRLTSAAVMFLTYAAYLMLRSGIENVENRRRFASIYGIFAITTAIFTLIVIRIRPDTIHPAVIGSSPASSTTGGFKMPREMLMTMLYTLTVWSVFLTPVLIWWRIRLENTIESLRQHRADVLGDA